MKWTRGRRHHSWWFIDLEMKVSWWSRLRKGVQDPCVVGADEPFPCLAYLLSWSPVTRVLPPWQGYDHETGRIREGGVREIGGHEIEEIRHEIQMIVTHERGSMKVVQEQGVEVVGSLHSVPYHQPPCGWSELSAQMKVKKWIKLIRKRKKWVN